MTDAIDYKKHNRRVFRKRVAKSWRLYVFLLLPLTYIIIFKYIPMAGLQIAFKKYVITKGVWGSAWLGVDHFIRFFSSRDFWRVIRNTLALSVYGLIAGTPMPILLALLLNYVYHSGFKKSVQMISYAPHFISTVVMVGMIYQFTGVRYGLINNTMAFMGLERIDIMGMPQMFRHIFVWTDIWQHVGYSSIIYLAVLAGVPISHHEAAIIDGATKVQRMWHIDLPSIIPTATILFIMNSGRILNVGFEKVLLMQNDMNLEVSEIIATFVYKRGIAADFPNFSYSTAIGMFQSVVGLILLIIVNNVAKRTSENSLW